MAGNTEEDERVAVALARELEAAGLTARDISRLTILERPGEDLPPVLGREPIEALRAAGVQVTAIGVDDADDEVTVFLSRAVPARVRAMLPGAHGAVSIAYAVHRFQVVNPARLAKPHGQALRMQPEAEPVRCGASISLGNARAAGTLGALVKPVGESGPLFGMTCNHVTGGCNIVLPGVPVVHPGVLDVRETTTRIEHLGYHDRVLPIRQGHSSVLGEDENNDVALFRIRDDRLVSSRQGGRTDTPTVTREPSAGMAVRKAGRTTGTTRGTVKGFVTHTVEYNLKVPLTPDTVRTFQGICSFQRAWRVEGEGGNFAERGDSGALVMTGDGKHAVGLLFAAEDKGDGYFLALEPILKKLGMELVGGHNL